MAIAMIMPLIRLRLRCARRLRISLRDFGGSGGSAPRIGSDPCSTQCVLSSKNSLKSSVITDTSLLPGTVECRLQNHHCRLLVNHRPVLVRSFMGLEQLTMRTDCCQSLIYQ